MKRKQSPAGSRSRRLGLEQLESRRVLAGNVQASVRGGSLNIVGDSSDNEITVTYGANVFTIASRDGSTTINGQAGPLTFTGVRKDVNIALGNGDDVVEFDGGSDPNAAIWIRKRLNIDMGSGADQVLVTNVHVLRLFINLGTGNDTLNIGNDGANPGILVTKEANIIGGSGEDNVSIANSNFKKFVNVELNGNNDTLSIQDTSVRRRSNFNGGGGTDTLNRENNHGPLKFVNFETVNNTVSAPAPLPLAAVNDAGSVTEDATTTTVTGNVLTNDTGGTGTKTVSAVNGSAANINADVPGQFGTFHINANGSFTYTLDNTKTQVNNLNTGGSLTDTMGYTASAGGATSNATLTITINGHTDIVTQADTGSVTEDATPNTATGNVLTNDSGGSGTLTVKTVNGQTASVGADVPGQFGTFHINSNGSYTYTLDNTKTQVNDLNNGGTLTDTMNYTAGDGTQNVTGTLTITIQGHTDIATSADTANITEDATPNTTTGNVLSNDTGGNGTVTVTAVNGQASGVGSDVPGQFGTFHINANGTYTYTLNNSNTTVNALNNGGTLTDSMNYTASDGIQSVTGTLNVTIQGHTELDAVNDTGFSVTEDSATDNVTGNVITNDTGGNGTKSVSAVKGLANNVGIDVPGTHGTFHINSNGAFTYTLNNADTAVNNLNDNETLTDSIDYTLTDGIATDTATLTITIQGHTDP